MTVIARRVADKLMPWVAANATVWPSTHANQAVLLEQIRELETEAATNRGAVELRRELERLVELWERDPEAIDHQALPALRGMLNRHPTGGSSP